MSTPRAPGAAALLPACDCGVVYVAIGEKYLAEAAESREQLRRTNPTLAAALITDVAAPAGDWQVVLPSEQPTHSLRDKLQMRRAPWPYVLFLDTDTYVAADLSSVFQLLRDGFEVAAHQLFEGHNYTLTDVPDSFPEFNTGVIAFRNTPRVQAFFDGWAATYDRFFPSVRCDQRSFRVSVYHSTLRHTVLTPEYNFRPLSTNFAITDLRILHGRPISDMPHLKALIDVKFVHRAYVPRLGCVVADQMTTTQCWHLLWATILETIKTTSRPPRKFVRRLLRR